MQNTKNFKGLYIRQRIEQALYEESFPLMCAVYASCAFLAAMAKIMGGNAPFGISFAAAVPQAYILPAACGAMAGYLFTGAQAGGSRYILAVLFISAVKWFIKEKYWDEHKNILAPSIASAGILLFGILPILYKRPLVYDIVLWITEIVLGGAAAFFIYRTVECTEGSAEYENISLSVIYIIGIMGLCQLSGGGLSLGRTAAVFMIMIVSRISGISASVVLGIISGFAVGFSGTAFYEQVAAFAIGGLLAGLFAPLGRAALILSVFISNGCFTLILFNSFGGFAEAAAAAMLFFVMPAGWMNTIKSCALKNSGFSENSIAKERISYIQKAIEKTSKSTDSVAENIVRKSGDINGIYDRVSEKVCRGCPYATACWQTNYSDTVDAFSKFIRKATETGSSDESNLPGSFYRCIKRKELAKCLYEETKNYKLVSKERLEADRMRTILREYSNGVCGCIEDVKKDIEAVLPEDRETENKIISLLGEIGITAKNISCRKYKNGRVKVYAEVANEKIKDSTGEYMAEELSSLLIRHFAPPAITKCDFGYRLVFFEMPLYKASFGVHQIPFGENKVCGDSYKFIDNNTDIKIILSDGMGTGQQAAVDSILTVSLLSTLMEAGAGCASALGIINNELKVKGEYESCATVDCAEIDMYTGKMTVHKAGAVATLICRKGRGVVISSATLPAGILDKVTVKSSRVTLEKGDIVIMFTDGVVSDSFDWIVNRVYEDENRSMENLAEIIAVSAKLRRLNGLGDDITVICCKIEEKDE